MICQICTCLIFALVPVFVFGQTENQNSSQSELFVDYIFPRTNMPVDNPPPLFEEYYSKNGEAYLYGHHRGHGLKLVLADSLVTLAGIPVYPSITAHKGPVIPAPTAVISHQFGDFQREAWTKGESIETIHENAYRFLLSFALVDSVCRNPSHGSTYFWEVWFKGRSIPENLHIFDSMPPSEKTISPARKLRARRQAARNKFNYIKKKLQLDPKVILFISATSGVSVLPESKHAVINEIIKMSPEELKKAALENKIPISILAAQDLQNPRSLDYK